MKEKLWAKEVTERIHSYLKSISDKYAADVAQKLCYANEVLQYHGDNAECKETKFETDILIYEWVNEEVWKPRVVIETKIGSVTTHDAITYSKKAQNHRFVHPYLRYGMFIGNMGKSGVPARLLRHGEGFDFMISWEGYKSNKTEWEILCEIIESEINASQTLEDVLFNNRSRDRKKYIAYHRPLVKKPNEELGSDCSYPS